MFEDSVEGFIARWRGHATDAVAFARAEGSPLLEDAVGDVVVQLLERTGPYEAPTGPVRVLLHAIATDWMRPDAARPSCDAIGPSRLRLVGRVIEVDAPLVVVDAGVPIVLGLDPATGAAAPWPEVGDWLGCDTLAPAHGFVLRGRATRAPATSPDDQV